MEDGTPSIEVLPATSEHLRALLARPDSFGERFGLSAEDGLDVFPGTIAHSLATLENEAGDPEWHSHLYLFVDLDRKRVVGLGGYKGPPRAGTVEIGYAVAPAARGRGVATAAVRQLVGHARQQGSIRCIAHTLAEHSASTAVLERCGFSQVGEAIDPEEGPVWRWELALG